MAGILLAWVLAMFYLYGSLHHSRVAWGLFVLPLLLGLVVLARVFHGDSGPRPETVSWEFLSLQGKDFWPVARFYGPLKPLFDKTWVMADVEEVK